MLDNQLRRHLPTQMIEIQTHIPIILFGMLPRGGLNRHPFAYKIYKTAGYRTVMGDIRDCAGWTWQVENIQWYARQMERYKVVTHW